jgi:peptidyl-prolyl cis-trans isomerase C
MRPIKRNTRLTAILLVTVTLGASASAEDRALAVVDGQAITEVDMRLAEIEWGDAVAALPFAERRKTLMAFLIESQLLAKAAADEKVLSGEEAIGVERFSRRLALRNVYFERRVKASVTETDAKRLYDSQSREIPLEDEVKVRHILVETRERAAELKRTVVGGMDFATAAQKFSQDPTTNVVGGDLGYSVKGQLLAEIDEVAFSLKKGEVSEPVKSQFGWHLVLVEDRRVRALPTFEQLKQAITKSLLQRKAQDTIAELRTKARINVRDPSLAAALEPAKTVATPTPAAQAVVSSIQYPGALTRELDGEFGTYANGDIYGGDFQTLKGVEQKACSFACQANAQCQAFSYDRWNRWCYLKSVVGELAFEPGSVSGVKKTLAEPAKSTAAVRIDRHLAKGYAGSLKRTTAVLSIEQCEETCGAEKSCVGYTYSKRAKACKVFDQIDSFAPEAGAVSGHKTQTPP